jgi:hypothetical protein
MKIYGTVKDAKYEKGIQGAKVCVSVGDKELAVLSTDNNGKFELGVEESYAGKTLVCRVEKKGYHPRELVVPVKKDKVTVDTELDPVEEDKPPAPVKKGQWPKIAIGMAGLAIVVAIIALLVVLLQKGPEAHPEPGAKWSDGTNQAIYYDRGRVGVGTTTPEAALDVHGDIKGGGVLAGIWFAKPTNAATLQRSNRWEDVPNTSVKVVLDGPARLFCTYSINVQPDWDPGAGLLGTRLMIDNVAMQESGSHFQPYHSGDANVNLNGNSVVELGAGSHNVKLQWRKNTDVNWTNHPGWSPDYIGGRTLVVMAFYE